jgi:hypothetical protein
MSVNTRSNQTGEALSMLQLLNYACPGSENLTEQRIVPRRLEAIEAVLAA